MLALEKKVNATLSDILGPHSVEYGTFGDIRLDTAPVNIYHSTPIHEVRDGYTHGISKTVSALEAIIELLEEKVGGLDSPATRAKRSLAEMELHPEIARAATDLFQTVTTRTLSKTAAKY